MKVKISDNMRGIDVKGARMYKKDMTYEQHVITDRIREALESRKCVITEILLQEGTIYANTQDGYETVIHADVRGICNENADFEFIFASIYILYEFGTLRPYQLEVYKRA